MRALLVVNPTATTTSERGRDVLTRALGTEVDLTVAYTRKRGHAAEFARQAVRDGIDVVVTLGGDGTVNEVVNGLLHDGPGERVPALAVVPGGSTNVFARALGLPRDWTESTGVILEALHRRRVRSVGLGLADERYFTFCAGLGLDARVVRAVERARLRGQAATPALYLRSTVTQLLMETDWRAQVLTLERPGDKPAPNLAMAIIQNTAPWTFLGDRQLNACSQASFDAGLDVMALRKAHVGATARTAIQILSGRRDPHGRHVLAYHDLSEFTIVSTTPLPFQLDGDYLGERSAVTFRSVPHALRVFA